LPGRLNAVVTPIRIDMPHDPRLDRYRSLRDPERRAALEATGGHFVAEGITVVRRLLESTVVIHSVLVLEGREDGVLDLVGPDIDFLVVPKDVMNTVVGFDLHRGVLACAQRPPNRTISELAATSRVIAVLEGINDHENIGAIARSARALGVDAMLLDPTTADPWYRRAVRVSMGEMMYLPIGRAAQWPDALDELRAHGFTIAALTPAADAVALNDFASRGPERVALLLGAEGPGLSRAALAASDVRLRIPIRSSVDSLNVGHAAAVAFAALGHLSTER
jgi:tRNA(Leu) C34 or U34 (ribose-2'-O)-methylase TrmL